MTKQLLEGDDWECVNLAKEPGGKFLYAGELNLFFRDPLALIQAQYSSGVAPGANFHENASVTMVEECNPTTGLKENVRAYEHPMTCE